MDGMIGSIHSVYCMVITSSSHQPSSLISSHLNYSLLSSVIDLRQVLDTIDSLYASKQVANEKAMRGVGNVPMETMEQHTFRTYEKKYGYALYCTGTVLAH
jgi:hypothetical protein